MPMLSTPSFGPRTALAYVTGGTLLDVWTLVWYFTRDNPLTHGEQFWVVGFVLTGLTFVILGLLLGPLGRAARQSELPPVDATRAEAAIQQTAAANPPAVVTATGGAVAPGVAGQPAITPANAMPAAPAGMIVPQTPVVRVG